MKFDPSRFGFIICLLVAARVHAAAAADDSGYNVLVLMTDEHNPRIMGCSGDPLVQTPALDSLAARGVRFTSAYCQNPICVPSRVALASGRMPSNLGVFGNSAPNSIKYENITTLADVFVRGGYNAVWFGKTHWGDPRFLDAGKGGANSDDAAESDETLGRLPQQSKVSDWPVEKNPEHVTANRALSFLEENKSRKFFLGVSFVKPHFPFTIQQKYYDLYRGKVSLPRASEKLIRELPALSKEEREKYHHAGATEEDILRTKAIYYGMVTYVDEEFGRILKKLDELGLREKTIIVYTADHGEMLGDRGIWYKNSFYDGSATIPFIWSFPKALPQGKVVRAPAMNIDVLPTLCDLCALPKPTGLEGSSLVPVMTGRNDGRDRIALSENYRGNFAGRMIRTAKWKYFLYTNGEEYLYDLESDPGEETNLIKDPRFRATADELKQKATAGWVQGKRSVRDIVGQPDGAKKRKK
jgi:arylsulfatase A-like enzyme